MKTHTEYKAERVSRDSEFKIAYDALEEEYALRRGVITARLDKGLTQAELAELMGTTQSAVSRLESGEFNPRVETLSKLAAVLDVEFRIAAGGSRVVPSPRSSARLSKRRSYIQQKRRSASTAKRGRNVSKKPSAA